MRVKEIQTQHQIDLVNLSDMRVEYQGTVYRYVPSIMDIFSRFHWLAPLERKKPSHIVPHLRQIYSVHGPPKNLKRKSKLFAIVGRLEELVVVPIILNHRVKLNVPTES